MTITEYLEKQPRSVLILLGLVLLILIATGDFLTHSSYLLEFSPFYLVPISFLSWFAGRGVGSAAAIASVAIGFYIRLRPVPVATAYWDSLVWFALYMGTVLMTAQLKRLYEHEKYLSRVDPLTLVENRRGFFESAARMQNFSDRHGAPFSVAYLDLDDFKQLNDRRGHSTGDKLLATVGIEIRKALRPTDVVGRMGGDEFALLLPETDKETASKIVGRVLKELERAMRERSWPMTFSIGLVNFSPPLPSVPEMLAMADEAMYAAKHRGKNRIERRDVAV